MNKDLTTGDPGKVLWRFCLPLFGSIIFQQIYNIADSLVAGKFIGARRHRNLVCLAGRLDSGCDPFDPLLQQRSLGNERIVEESGKITYNLFQTLSE